MSGNGCKTLRTFDEVLHDVVFNSRSKINAKSIAEDTRISYWRLSNWANVEQDEHNLPGKHVSRITNASRDTSLVEHICLEVGGVFIPLPNDGQEIKISNCDDALLEMVQHQGELVATYRKAASDNTITGSEGATMEKILSRLAQHSVSLIQHISSLVKR
jgi:hypothetical protein